MNERRLRDLVEKAPQLVIGLALLAIIVIIALLSERFSGQSLTEAGSRLDPKADIQILIRAQEFDPDSGTVQANATVSYPLSKTIAAADLRELAGVEVHQIVDSQVVVIETLSDLRPPIATEDKLLFNLEGDPATYPWDKYAGFLSFQPVDRDGSKIDDLAISVAFAGSFPGTIMTVADGASVLSLNVERTGLQQLAFIFFVLLVLTVLAVISVHAAHQGIDVTVVLGLVALTIGLPAIREMTVPDELDTTTFYDLTIVFSILSVIIFSLIWLALHRVPQLIRGQPQRREEGQHTDEK